jgi:hypothetical protein
MANQTLTNTTLNHDSPALLGLLNGESYTINNSTLIYNGDTRWGQNAAVPGVSTISSTLGGKILIDGRDVWEIPFSSSTGNVPAFTDLGSNGIIGGTSGATGELFRVWANNALEPSAAGGSMPATGWIKLRTKTGNFSAGETVTLPGGATVVISNPGRRSWINVATREAVAITVPRLGKLEIIGDWYELGATNGSDDQTFQFPIAAACPAIQIETSPGSNEYEWYLNSGDRWGTATQYIPTDDARGKFFGMDNTTGNITLAQRASNSCGFKPASGCKVRIPNIILTNAPNTNYALNTVPALASRHVITTTSAGNIDIRNACGAWYFNFSAAFQILIRDSCTFHAIGVTNTANSTELNNVAVGLTGALIAQPFTASNLFTNLVLNSVRMCRYGATGNGQTTITLTDVANITATNLRLEQFGSTTGVLRGFTTISNISMTRCLNAVFTNSQLICGRVILASCINVSFTNVQYADNINSVTTSSQPLSLFEANATSANILIDGISAFDNLVDVNPYTSFLVVATGANGVTLKNIGTPDTPYNCGTQVSSQMGVLVSGSVTLNLTLQRIYTQNLRNNATAVLSLTNTVQNVTIENVWADTADISVLAAINVRSRGNKWIPSVTGQTACYSRHWDDSFLSTTRGNVSIYGNEPLAVTADQCSFTFAEGSGFTSTGGYSGASVNDEVIWTHPYYVLGHKKLGGSSNLFATGTLVQNHEFDYQIDTGSGFSDWKFMFASRVRSSGGNAGGNTVTIAAVTGTRPPAIGDYVGTQLGTQFVPGTTITNIVGNVLTFSSNILVSIGTNVVIYYWKELEDEPEMNPNTGFKLKVRSTTKIANTTNLITYVQIPTVTDEASHKIQYPLPGVPVNLTGLVAGSEVRAYVGTDPSTAVQIDGIETSLTSFTFGHNHVGQQGYIIIFALGYQPVTISLTYSASEVTIPIQQVIDRVYANA